MSTLQTFSIKKNITFFTLYYITLHHITFSFWVWLYPFLGNCFCYETVRWTSFLKLRTHTVELPTLIHTGKVGWSLGRIRDYPNVFGCGTTGSCLKRFLFCKNESHWWEEVFYSQKLFFNIPFVVPFSLFC